MKPPLHIHIPDGNTNTPHHVALHDADGEEVCIFFGAYDKSVPKAREVLGIINNYFKEKGDR